MPKGNGNINENEVINQVGPDSEVENNIEDLTDLENQNIQENQPEENNPEQNQPEENQLEDNEPIVNDEPQNKKPQTLEERRIEAAKLEAQLDTDTTLYLGKIDSKRIMASSSNKNVIADDCKNVLDTLDLLADKKGMSRHEYTKELIRTNIDPEALVAYYNTTRSQQINSIANMPKTITNEKDLDKAYKKWNDKSYKTYVEALSKKDERAQKNYQAHLDELEDLAAVAGKSREDFLKELISKGVDPYDYTWKSIEERDKTFDSFKNRPETLEGLYNLHEKTINYLQSVEDRENLAGTDKAKLNEIAQETYTLETLAEQEGISKTAFVADLLASGIDPQEYARDNAVEMPKSEEQLEEDANSLLGKLETKRVNAVKENKTVVANDCKDVLDTLNRLATKNGVSQQKYTVDLLRDGLNPEAFARHMNEARDKQLQALNEMPKKLFKKEDHDKAYIKWSDKNNKTYLQAVAKNDQKTLKEYKARMDELEEIAALSGKSTIDLLNDLVAKGIDPDEYAQTSIDNREKDLKSLKENPKSLEEMGKAQEKAAEYLQGVQDRKNAAGSDQAKLDEIQKESDTLEILAAAEGVPTNTFIANLEAKGIDPTQYVHDQIKDQEAQLNQIEAQQNMKKYQQRETELSRIAAAAGLSREELGKVISNSGYEANQYAKFVPGTPEHKLQIQKLKEAEERKKQIEADKKFAEELKAKEEALAKKEAELKAKENELQNNKEQVVSQTKDPNEIKNVEVVTSEKAKTLADDKEKIEKALNDHQEFTKQWNEIRDLKENTPEQGKYEDLAAMQDELEAKFLGSDNKFAKGKEVGKRMGIPTDDIDSLQNIDVKIGDRAVAVFGEPAENFPGDPKKSPQERKTEFLNNMLGNGDFSKDPANAEFINKCEQKYADEKKNMQKNPGPAADRIHEALQATVTVSLSNPEISTKDIALATVTDCMASTLKNGDMKPAMEHIEKTHTTDELNRLQCQVRGVSQLGTIAKNGIIAKGELSNTTNLSKEDIESYSKDYLTMKTTDELLRPSKNAAKNASINNTDVSIQPAKSNSLLALGAMPVNDPAKFVNHLVGSTNVSKQLYSFSQDQLKDLIKNNDKLLRQMSRASVSQCIETLAKNTKQGPMNEKKLLKSANELTEQEIEKKKEENKKELKPVNQGLVKF